MFGLKTLSRQSSCVPSSASGARLRYSRSQTGFTTEMSRQDSLKVTSFKKCQSRFGKLS